MFLIRLKEIPSVQMNEPPGDGSMAFYLNLELTWRAKMYVQVTQPSPGGRGGGIQASAVTEHSTYGLVIWTT